MTVPAERWRVLTDRYYANTITLAESREFKGYVQEKLAELEKRPEALEKVMLLRLLDSALFARIHIMSKAEA